MTVGHCVSNVGRKVITNTDVSARGRLDLSVWGIPGHCRRCFTLGSSQRPPMHTLVSNLLFSPLAWVGIPGMAAIPSNLGGAPICTHLNTMQRKNWAGKTRSFASLAGINDSCGSVNDIRRGVNDGRAWVDPSTKETRLGKVVGEIEKCTLRWSRIHRRVHFSTTIAEYIFFDPGPSQSTFT